MSVSPGSRVVGPQHQHEDEGYLSPSEEDLKNYPIRPGSFLNCKNVNASCVATRTTAHPGGVLEDDSVPWDEIACIPYVRDEHLSWDKLKLPVPYRFHDEHRICLRQVRTAPSVSYVTDSNLKLPEVVKNIWRSSGNPEKEVEEDVNDKTLVNNKLPPSVKSAVECLQSGIDDPVYISVKEFVQHVLHLVCGRESLSFCLESGKKYIFTKNPFVVVHGMSPNLVLNLSLPFLTCGRIFKRLSHLSALHYDEKLMEREGLQSNAIFVAFLKFISDYLKLYQTSVMLKASGIQSFSALNIFFMPFRHQLETLEKILDLYIATDQITLMKGLNTLMLRCETPFVADLLRSVFIACTAAYLRYVSDWIFRGVLTKGFHIERTKSCTYQDRRYWIKQFTQVSSVPTFLESALNIVFETGKAINLLNLIRNTETKSTLLSCILHDEGTILQPTVEFEEVTTLQNEWKIKVDSFFQEYSFLQSDVDSTLLAAGGRKHTLIDFDAVEEAKQAFETRRLEIRQQTIDQKALRQKTLANALNEQIAQKRVREKKQKEDDELENKRISAYIDYADQRDLDEETRLMKKHFGDMQVVDTVGLRNVKQRIALTENPIKVAEGEGDIVVDIVVRVPANDITDAANTSQEIFLAPNALEDDFISENIKTDTSDTTVRHSLTKTLSMDPSNSKSMRTTEKVSVPSTSVNNTKPNIDALVCGEKFNPDKLKVRDPEQYNINLDFTTSSSNLLPQPIVQFSTTVNLSNEDSNAHENSITGFRHDSFFLNRFLNQSVTIPVGAQNRLVNSALLHYFIVEKKLFQHVQALNNYLCLHNGLFGHFLSNLLIQEVKTGALSKKDDIPRKSGRLNEILGEAMALSAEGSDKNDFRDHLGFIMARESNRNSIDLDTQKPVKSRTLTSDYEVLDDITLNYSVEWPLSIIITDDLLINYEKLFTFLMRLYRAELLLLSLSKILKFKGSKSKQLAVLHHYRYRMLHFVRSVRHYINVTVIHSAWTELVASFHKMNSLDRIYEGLVRHIKFVTTNCLLGTKGEGVKKLLVDQLIVIECFCSEVQQYNLGINWDAGEEIPSRRFTKLDQKFKVWEEIQKVFIQGKKPPTTPTYDAM